MEASVYIDGFTAYGSAQYKVPLGKEFMVALTTVPHPIKWFADNDSVLSIEPNGEGTLANIKATAVGHSRIQLQGRGPHVDRVILVEVYQPGTVRVNATFTNIRLK
jgi:hypothetical protein